MKEYDIIMAQQPYSDNTVEAEYYDVEDGMINFYAGTHMESHIIYSVAVAHVLKVHEKGLNITKR